MIKIKRIKRLSIIIIVVIVSGFFGYKFGLSQGGQFLKSIVEPGSMVTEASYVIFTDGLTVYARDGNTGEIVKSSTNASEVINWIIRTLTNGRTWYERIVLKGNFTIDSPIQVDSYTILELEGKITLADNSNCNLVENRTKNVVFVGIYGGTWDGNKARQTRGNGFFFSANAPDNVERIDIENVELINIKDIGIYLNRALASKVLHSKILNTGSHGFWGDVLHDSIIDDIIFSNVGGVNFLLLNSGANRVSNLYCGGASYIEASSPYDAQFYVQSNAGFFSNIFVDYIYLTGFHVFSGSGNSFNNIRISGPKNPNLNALKVENTIDNTFNNIHIEKIYDGSWNIGINEMGTSDYNVFTNVVARDSTIAYKLIGSHSSIKNSIPFTENSGVVSIKNDDFITHDLAATPSLVTITPTAQRVTAVPFKNSTHFQVGLWDNSGNVITAPEDVYWYAEV